MQKGHVCRQAGFVPIIILIGILVLASVGGVYFFKVRTPVQRVCTMDAKICPDGSSVGRSGSNCEFAPCPTNYSPTTNPVIHSQEKFLESYGIDNSGWKKYMIKPIKFEFKIPKLLLKQGELRETVDKGQVGQQVIISSIDEFLSFSLGLSTIDYQQGRGGGFLDYQRFEIENRKYYAKFVGNQKFEIPEDAVNEVKNPNGIDILKVRGKSQYNEEWGNRPIVGTPGEGYFGALINVNNPNYSGVVIQMKFDKNLTEQVFDQVLSTFKFLK